jgi:hypothetical protein
MQNYKVYCLISVLNWFVIISKFTISFSAHMNRGVGSWRRGYGMGADCFAIVMLHSSVSYHQMHALPMATEPHQLHKDYHTTCSVVIIRSHRVSNL